MYLNALIKICEVFVKLLVISWKISSSQSPKLKQNDSTRKGDHSTEKIAILEFCSYESSQGDESKIDLHKKIAEWIIICEKIDNLDNGQDEFKILFELIKCQKDQIALGGDTVLEK